MATNKRKILEAARKFVQKGAHEKALKEYRKLLKLDPRDAKLRLEIGDAYRRWGQVDEAVETYTKVAQQYMDEGFDARAVAVFKQIQNLDPDRYASYEPLSELYQRMGLTAEAIQALQTAADGYRRDGHKHEALKLLRKMVALDATNTTSRIKVADLLRQEGLIDEAFVEYSGAAEELERQGDAEGASRVLERVLELDPNRPATLMHLAQNLLSRRQPEQAEPFARRAVEVGPDVPEHYELLAEVYRAQRREDALADTYRGLAALYQRRGEADRARDIMQRFVPSESFGTLSAEEGAMPLELDTGGSPLLGEDPVIGEDGPFGQPGEPFSAEDTVDASEGGEDARELFGEETVFGDVAHGSSLLDDEFLDDEPLLEEDAEPAEDDPTELRTLSEQLTQPDASPPPPDADPEQLLAEASVYLRYGKRAHAIVNLEAVVQRDPQHRGALEKLGDARAEQGETRRAVESWSRAAEVARAQGDADGLAILRDRIAALDEEAAAALAPAAEKEGDGSYLDIAPQDVLAPGDDSSPDVELGVGAPGRGGVPGLRSAGRAGARRRLVAGRRTGGRGTGSRRRPRPR